MNKTCYLGVILMIAMAGNAGAEWVSFGGGPGTPPDVSLISDDPSETIIEFELYGFELGDTTIDSKRYSTIELPTAPFLEKRGYPRLPKVARSLIIPDLARMELEILTQSTEEMRIPPVLPSKGMIGMWEIPDTVSLVFSELYERGGDFPSGFREDGETLHSS